MEKTFCPQILILSLVISTLCLQSFTLLLAFKHLHLFMHSANHLFIFSMLSTNYLLGIVQ